MKHLKTYERLGLLDEDAVFGYLIDSLSDGIRDWDYFVNWDKVFRNTRESEVNLNLWNFLVGKTDFDNEFRALIGQHPASVSIIPTLLVRDGKASQTFHIFHGQGRTEFFDFTKPADSDDAIEAALRFVKETGLINLFVDGGVKNLVDYVIGVEAGVDSNGRKNRGGTAMEGLTGELVEKICGSAGYEFLDQATPDSIQRLWGFDGLAAFGRRFDFAVRTPSRVFVLETNFYNAGGSKLKATAGEFIELNSRLDGSGAHLIWITDGKGWGSGNGPLRDAFSSLDFVMNLRLIADGALEEALGS